MRTCALVMIGVVAGLIWLAGSPCEAQYTPPAARDAQAVEAILAQSPRASTERPLQVVLVAGVKDHGPGEHDYPLWQKRWKVLLGGVKPGDEPVLNLFGPAQPVDKADLAGAENVRVSTAWEWPSEEQWKTANLVVLFSAPPWNAKRLDELESYLNRGGGFVTVHMPVWYASPKLLKLLGAAFRNEAQYRHGALALRLVASHPICLGLPETTDLVDESYFNLLNDPAGTTVLATSRETLTGQSAPRDEPMIWARQQGKGRVVVCILGHFTWTFDDPLFRILLLRGMSWAAGESPYRFDPLVLRGARVAAGESAGPNAAAMDAAMAALATYGWDKSRLALAPIDEVIRHADPAARADLENRLAAALAKGLPPAASDFVCRRLAQIGTSRSVPALASLLDDKDRAAMARYALAQIPADEAGAALLAGLPKATGPARLEIIHALGRRCYQPATTALLDLLGGDDRQNRDAALAALAQMGAPEAVEPALAQADAPVDSLVTLAERLAAGGHKEPARKLYARLATFDSPPVRAAVLRGLVLLEPSQAAERLLAALGGNDARLRGQAAALLERDCDESCVTAVVGAFDDLPLAAQQSLLAAGWTRHPSLGRRCALAGAISENPEICRQSAVLLRNVGVAEDVAMLSKMASHARPEVREAAELALRYLAADGTNRQIVELLAAPGTAQRVALIRAADQRHMAQAVPVLVNLIQSADKETRVASLVALQSLGDPTVVATIVPRLLAAGSPQERTAAERAVWLCSQRCTDPQSRAEPLLRAIEKASPEDRVRLLPVLGRLGGRRALEVVRQAGKSEDAAQRDAATSALANWPDATVADELLDLARHAEKNPQRIRALRGYIRVVTLRGVRPDDQTLAMLRQAMPLAVRVEEKRLILSRLSAMVVPESLELALSYLDEEDLRDEAIATSTRLAELLLPKHPAAAKAAMKRILSVTTDKKLQQRLERQLKK